MTFIHQHQVVALKKAYSHRLVTVGISQFGNLKDIDSMTFKQSACGILVEYAGFDVTFTELFEMLVCQALIRRNKNDAIGLLAILLGIMAILQHIYMHEQCLARTSGRPESHLVQVGLREIRHAVIGLRIGIETQLEIRVYVGKQLLPVAEIFVEIYFREQQAEVLEIFPLDLSFALLADRFGMTIDVLVIGQQHLFGQLAGCKQP